MKVPIDYESAPVEIQEIYYAVCLLFKIDIRNQCRRREYVEPRTIYFALCRKLTPYSMTVIASFIDRDHCTCVHGLKVFSNLMETDAKFREKTKKALYKCCILLGSDFDNTREYLVDNFPQLDVKQQRSILHRVKFYVHENMSNVKSPAYA